MTNEVRAIKCIQVDKLFGTYTYKLYPLPQACNPNRLLILYGDNGSGKTKILRTIFHLLAPEGSEGHKTAVAKVPFRKFEVHFTSGEHVWAERREGHITGTFTMGIQLVGKKAITFEFIANEEGSVKSADRTPEMVDLLATLQQLNIGLYFLSDDRTVRLAGKDKREMPLMQTELFDDEVVLYQGRDLPPQVARMGRTIDQEKRAQHLLQGSIKRAEMWIQSQAVRDTAKGESNVNTLYAEILARISKLPLDENPTPIDAISKIKGHINQLEIRSKQFAQYGLLPEFFGRDIISIIKSAPISHLGVIINVVTPYIESVEKKLDALARLQIQINTLVTILNSFFKRKNIFFEIHEGFKILTTEEGKNLMPQMLSSGERHLLLLFLNTLISLDRQSIFIIDEPEISLNIKWQRRLITSLLQCVGENPVQYLFATHSFELLAQHKNNTIKLIET